MLTLCIVWAATNSTLAETSATDALDSEARGIATQFISRLKPQLKMAMKEGGPTHAIEICAREAPRIADALSAGSGWNVNRVSLKSRNASRAQPDSWEAGVLKQFDSRAAAGESASAINFSEISGNRFRYMQAQGVEPVCLVCHGMDLAAPVRATLEQYYPDDWATGYQLGQVRGAISLSRGL
jgi:hypothetical protein